MSSEQADVLHVWTLILEPENGSTPEWAAWVTADDANWGTFRIIHVPSKRIAAEEDVPLSLNFSDFFKGQTLEQQWEELARNWVRDNKANWGNRRG